MKLTNINNKAATEPFEFVRVKQVEICAPVSQSLEWYKLSKWRAAQELFAQYPELWKKWKLEGKIPESIINKVELRNEIQQFSL